MFEELLPYQEYIDVWKEQYGDIYAIYLSDNEEEFGHTFVFRTLGREEYKGIYVDHIDDMGVFQEKICEAGILVPQGIDFDTFYAGFPEVMSDYILRASGYAENQAQELLTQYREDMYIYDYQADCIIHEAFPEFSIEQIQNWNNHRTMFYLSRAEYVLMELRGVPLMSVEDVMSNQQAQQQQVQAQVQQPPVQQAQPPTGFDNNFFATPKEEMYPEFQEQLEQTPVKPVEKKEEPPKAGEMTEADMLAMLSKNEASKGKQISNPNQNQGLGDSTAYPELSWFTTQDSVTGDYD